MLEIEHATFEERRSEFLEKYPGKCILIIDDQFLGAFPTVEAAYSVGVERFGRRDMLIRLVEQKDPLMPIAPALLVGLTDAPAHPGSS